MQNENLEVLMEVPEIIRIGIDAEGRRKVEDCFKLQVLYLQERDSVFLAHDKFIYCLNKQVPVFANTRPADCYIGKRYVFSLKGEQKAFVFQNHVEESVQRNLEALINQYSTLYFANDGQEPEWIDGTIYANEAICDTIHKSQLGGFAQTNQPPPQERVLRAGPPAPGQPNPEDQTISHKIGNFFSMSGDILKQGITITGEFIGKGIRATSGAFKKLVGKNEKPVVVQPATIQKVRAANALTKTVTTYSKQQIANFIDFSFNLGRQAKEEFIKTERGKNITQNKYFIHGANIGAGVVNMFGGIYDGLENAFRSVATGTKGMTESVLEHKYGPQVKSVFANGAGAVYEVYDLKATVRKEVIKQTTGELKKEFGYQTAPELTTSVFVNPQQKFQDMYKQNLNGTPK